MEKYKLIVYFLILIFSGSRALDPTVCGDWEPFKESHCYKIIDKTTFHTFDEAEKLCQQNEATLIQIHYKEEQDFLANYIFNTNKIVDNVWLGTQFEPTKKLFIWTKDGQEVTFSNWQVGYPKNISDHCGQLINEEGQVGKWIDELCQKKALVVCQKKQIWSIGKLQEILLEVKQNPVPIDFIYVQLPKERSPSEIWPWMGWTDITSTYGGMFFRAEGGNSGPFGQIQEGNAPRLIRAESMTQENHGWTNRIADVPIGDWSNYMNTESTPSGINLINIRFQNSGGEVRPRNMAMKIWKRTA